MGTLLQMWHPRLEDRRELERLSELFSLMAWLLIDLREDDPAERRLARELERWRARIGEQLEAAGYVEEDEEGD